MLFSPLPADVGAALAGRRNRPTLRLPADQLGERRPVPSETRCTLWVGSLGRRSSTLGAFGALRIVCVLLIDDLGIGELDQQRPHFFALDLEDYAAILEAPRLALASTCRMGALLQVIVASGAMSR